MDLTNIPIMPSNHSNATFTPRIRFNVTTPGTLSITRKDLLHLFVVPTTAILAHGILKSCRIVSVKAWGIASSATIPIGHNSEILLDWLSDLGDDETIRATQMGISPAYLDSRPPRNSLAGFWTNGASLLTEPVLALTTFIGTYVDITFQCLLSNNTVDTFAISSGTIGQVSVNTFAGGAYDPQGYAKYIP